jgi:hypothetical protein
MVYDWKSKKRLPKQVTTKYLKLGGGNTLAIAKRGLAFHLYTKLMHEEIPLTHKVSISLDEKLTRLWINPVKIPLIDKWREIFTNHPKGPERGAMQIEDFDTITSSSSGIVSLFTGYGKTELNLAIAESFMEMDEESNILIFVFANKVAEEIVLRAQKYGVNIPKNFSTDSRVNVINPSGFSRTVAYRDKDPKLMAWLKKVNIILPDEGHHLSASTWQDIIATCDPDYVYPFTASGDVENGDSINKDTIDFVNNPDQMISVVSIAGYDLVCRELPVPIDLVIVDSNIMTEAQAQHIVNKYPNSLGKMVNDFITYPEVGYMLAEIYKKVIEKDICYISVFTVESGWKLCEALNSKGVRTVFWSAELALIPGGNNTTAEANEMLTLEELKALAREGAFDVLITTSVGVEGIDIPNLSSVCPLTGKSFRMTVQPVGRAARSDAVICILIFDRNNRVLMSQMKMKMKRIKDKLQVVRTRKFKWDGSRLT